MNLNTCGKCPCSRTYAEPAGMTLENSRRLASEFVERAKGIADDILGSETATEVKPREHIGSVHVHHYHDYGWWHPVYIINGPSRRHRNEDDSAARFFIGMLAAVVGGFALYHFGNAVKHFSEAKEELKNIRPFINWSHVVKSEGNTHCAFAETIEKIARIETRIFSRIKNQAACKLIETAGIVAGSSLALIGAIYAAHGLITMGIGLGLVSSGSMLFRWGMDSTERDHAHDAHALRAALSSL